MVGTLHYCLSPESRVCSGKSSMLALWQDPFSQLHHQAKPKTKHALFSLFKKNKNKKQQLLPNHLFADSIRRFLGINITVLLPQLSSMCQRGLENERFTCQAQFGQTLHSKESPVFWRTGPLLASETRPLKPGNILPDILFSYA